MTPLRIQRRRTKGWRMPANTVSVCRPGRYGNPIPIGTFRGFTAADAVREHRLYLARDLSVRSYENSFGPPPSPEQIRADLGRRNVACYCKLCDEHASGKPVGVTCARCAPCHGDTLLEIANGAAP